MRDRAYPATKVSGTSSASYSCSRCQTSDDAPVADTSLQARKLNLPLATTWIPKAVDIGGYDDTQEINASQFRVSINVMDFSQCSPNAPYQSTSLPAWKRGDWSSVPAVRQMPPAGPLVASHYDARAGICCDVQLSWRCCSHRCLPGRECLRCCRRQNR